MSYRVSQIRVQYFSIFMRILMKNHENCAMFQYLLKSHFTAEWFQMNHSFSLNNLTDGMHSLPRSMVHSRLMEEFVQEKLRKQKNNSSIKLVQRTRGHDTWIFIPYLFQSCWLDANFEEIGTYQD